MSEELKIIYETNHYIVVVKPAGILSQGDHTLDMDMMTMIKAYLKNKYQKPGEVFLGLVHRLDRMTSGLMVYAKTSKGASRLSEQIRNNEFTKQYLAMVEGELPLNEEVELINYLIKDEQALKAYIVNNNGKYARLIYKPLAYQTGNTIIDVTLFTGRYHQIRAQLSNIGHPLVGDTLYGSRTKCFFHLHAYKLSFKDPITKEDVSYINYPTWYKKEM